jgi:8-oxo-dGTP diphosphatase
MPASTPSDSADGLAAPFAQPYTTVDLVIFTVMDETLKVLLARRPLGAAEPYPGRWGLPGGYVDVTRDATLHDCAVRKLQEKTGVVSPYLEQLGSWGSRDRDPRGWSATHVYFALIAAAGLPLRPGGNATELRWFTEDERAAEAPLAFDHDKILQAALERLQSKVEYTSLPAFLLPEPFTLPQLQRVYEAVLNRALDKSAFRTRMLAADFLEEEGYVPGESNRPAKGYRLKDRRESTVFPRTFRVRE